MTLEFEINKKSVMILGGTGSWGYQLTKSLLKSYDIKEIIIYSRGEIKQHEMRKYFKNHPKLRFIIGDVRDLNRLNMVMEGVDLVISLAALKHVPICEENPWEAVMTNIIGTNNAIQAAVKNNVKRFVLVSTDKAVDPYNLYGVTKACAEKLVINANNFHNNTSFLCVRGGNVLGTNGSVLPLFKELINKNNFITVTDPQMTRFMMYLEDAMELVLNAIENGIGGEIFVMKMKSGKLEDISKAMVELFGNSKTEIKIVGARPGEKKDELLVSKNESTFGIRDKNFFVILPTVSIPRFDLRLKQKYSNLSKLDLNMEYSSGSKELLISYPEVKNMIEIYFKKLAIEEK